MNIKISGIIIFILSLSIPLLGQRGYYSQDTIRFIGSDLRNSGKLNHLFCSVIKGDEIIKYTPYEVSEYGFNHDKAYKAFDVLIDGQKERYFFLKIAAGNLNLFNIKLQEGINKYYLLPADSSVLMELPLHREQMQSMISIYADKCIRASKNLRYLKPNRNSLTRYINYLNSCPNYPYPKIQYGIHIGISRTQIFPVAKNSIFSLAEYNPDIGVTLGTFIDFPIFSNNISFSPEVYFKGSHYHVSYVNSIEGFDLQLNYHSLYFPLLFKYSFLRYGNIPFIKLGPVYSRVIKDKVSLYEFKMSDNEIFIEIIDSPIIQKNMGGVSLGGGLIFDLFNKYRLFGEVEYNYLVNLNSNDIMFNHSDFLIKTGIIF